MGFRAGGGVGFGQSWGLKRRLELDLELGLGRVGDGARIGAWMNWV